MSEQPQYASIQTSEQGTAPTKTLKTGEKASTFYTLGIVGLWLCSAVLLSNSLKWLFKTVGFKYPLTVTFGHMVFSNVSTGIYLAINGGKVPSFETKKRVWVLACAFILSVALSNIGIKHVEVSFAMTIGATAPLFTVIISAIVLAKQYSRFVYMSLVPIIVGMLMASKGEMHFDMVGFTCCTIGVIFRAVKSVIQQLILTDEKEKLNSIELLYYMSQPCILINGVWALAAESQDVIIDPVTYQTETAILYIITCCLAVSMNITTFLVTFLTSAVTLQILGQIKVVATILLSLVLFHNSMSFMGGFGCMLTISGAAAYAHVKDWKVAGAVAPSL